MFDAKWTVRLSHGGHDCAFTNDQLDTAMAYFKNLSMRLY